MESHAWASLEDLLYPYFKFVIALLEIKGLQEDVGAKCNYNGPRHVATILIEALARPLYNESRAKTPKDFITWLELKAVVESHVDSILHDTCRVFWLLLRWKAFVRAQSYGDGELLVSLMRTQLPFMAGASLATTNYFQQTVRFLRSLHEKSPYDRALTVFNLTVNRNGRVGCCESLDLHLEHAIKPLRAAFGPGTVTRPGGLETVALSSGMKRQVDQVFEHAVAAPIRSSSHSDVSVSRDVATTTHYCQAEWLSPKPRVAPIRAKDKTASEEQGEKIWKTIAPTGPVFCGMMRKAKEKIKSEFTPVGFNVPPVPLRDDQMDESTLVEHLQLESFQEDDDGGEGISIRSEVEIQEEDDISGLQKDFEANLHEDVCTLVLRGEVDDEDE